MSAARLYLVWLPLLLKCRSVIWSVAHNDNDAVCPDSVGWERVRIEQDVWKFEREPRGPETGPRNPSSVVGNVLLIGVVLGHVLGDPFLLQFGRNVRQRGVQVDLGAIALDHVLNV